MLVSSNDTESEKNLLHISAEEYNLQAISSVTKLGFQCARLADHQLFPNMA